MVENNMVRNEGVELIRSIAVMITVVTAVIITALMTLPASAESKIAVAQSDASARVGVGLSIMLHGE